jgi:hypothetical protein
MTNTISAIVLSGRPIFFNVVLKVDLVGPKSTFRWLRAKYRSEGELIEITFSQFIAAGEEKIISCSAHRYHCRSYRSLTEFF